MKKQCSTCVHFDVCEARKLCKEYYPLYDEINEETMDDIIESNRSDFHDEWQLYITKFND